MLLRGGTDMASKSANVMVRVEPEIKVQAEAVLDKLGLPVSVVINSLYRQIIMQHRLPFALTIPGNLSVRNQTMAAQFDAVMEKELPEA
jgi:addiction module RelB/DinJ family antitoxin